MNSLDSMADKETATIINIHDANNEIHFNSPINQSTVSKLVQELLRMESKIVRRQKEMMEKFMLMEKEDSTSSCLEILIHPKPILLFITSNGGNLFQVFSAVDTIMGLSVPVHTICKGFVASAGTLLSLAGSKRYMTPNSYLLIHELRSNAWGKYSQMLESMENNKVLMDHVKQFYLNRSKLTMEDLEEQLKKDQIWNAQMCLEKGLVDDTWPVLSTPVLLH